MADRCPKCGMEMVGPKGEILIICTTCATRHSHEALLNQQDQFIPRVIQQDHWVRLLRRAGASDWHVEFFGPNRGQGFCGVLFENPRKHSEWIAREERFSKLETVTNLCSKCHIALAQKVAASSRPFLVSQ